MSVRNLSDEMVISELRRAAAVWFRNDHLLLLEELVRRFRKFCPADDVSGQRHRREEST